MVDPIKTNTGLSVSDREAERRQPRRDSDGEGAQSPPPAAGADSTITPIQPGADLRLVIERDAEGVDYVYRLIDRATGRVVAERSRDQVATIADGPGYRAGAVVSTKA